MASFIDVCVLAASLATIAFYTWSLRAHFNSPRMPAGAKLISGGVLLAALLFTWLVVTRVQPLAMSLAGLVVESLSVGLFWWAISATRKANLRYAFDPEGPRGLVTTGPYRHLRHPFYSSYLLFWSGWALATATPWTVGVVILFGAFYVVAARREERLFAGSPMAGQYKHYRKHTGFLLPRLTLRASVAA